MKTALLNICSILWFVVPSVLGRVLTDPPSQCEMHLRTKPNESGTAEAKICVEGTNKLADVLAVEGKRLVCQRNTPCYDNRMYWTSEPVGIFTEVTITYSNLTAGDYGPQTIVLTNVNITGLFKYQLTILHENDCELPNIANATITTSSGKTWVNHGDVIEPQCVYGMRLSDSTPVTCNLGKWVSLPTCDPAQCQVPIITNATITNSSDTNWVNHGDVIEPLCVHGMRLSDSAPVTCDNGNWTFIPTCEPVPHCPKPSPLWNGKIIGDQTSIGARVYFRCNPRTRMTGSDSSMECLESRRWSTPVPQCLGQCQVKAIWNAAIVCTGTDGLVDHDSTIKPVCVSGMKLSDLRPVRCDNGTWSSYPTCVSASVPTASLSVGATVGVVITTVVVFLIMCVAAIVLLVQR